MSLVISNVEHRRVRLTAAEAGLVVDATGSGPAITIIDILPAGWEIRNAYVRTLGTITNGSGTTVLNLGTEDSGTAIINGLDLEGSAALKNPTVVPYRATAPVRIVAQAVVATAGPSAVAGIEIGVDIIKYAEENEL